MTRPYLHWSAHCSLYSGKTRSYLIKKGLPFLEATPGHARFMHDIRPAIGFFSVPVLETPDGAFIQDTTQIIRTLETWHPTPAMQPEDPVMRLLCWLIHAYGTEGLFKAAQHYRWSFPAENWDFVVGEFARGLASPEDTDPKAGLARSEAFAKAKVAALSKIGVTSDTIPSIEHGTLRVFDLLERHFQAHPYILGGRPSIADCGLMTALHAHLGRDPYPAGLMKRVAPALYRWTETMNRPGITDAEFSHMPPEYVRARTLPDTLISFLRFLWADFSPELHATLEAFENWRARTPDACAGSPVSLDGTPLLRQSLGQISYVQNGHTITREGWPDILLMHQYVLDVHRNMQAADRATLDAILTQIEARDMLRLIPSERLARSASSTVLASPV